MDFNPNEKSVTFINCPNCDNPNIGLDAYNFELGELALEQDRKLHVVYIICTKCGMIRTFIDRQKS